MIDLYLLEAGCGASPNKRVTNIILYVTVKDMSHPPAEKRNAELPIAH